MNNKKSCHLVAIRFFVCLFIYLLMSSNGIAFDRSQSFPPLKFVVPFPVGGSNDIAARLIANHLSMKTGQSIQVENKPGAAGMIGAQEVAKIKHNSNTFLMTAGGVLTTNQFIYKSLDYDPDLLFSPVMTVVEAPLILIVSSNSSYQSIRDLISRISSPEPKLNYGNAGIGSQSNMAGELFLSMISANALSIPYKGDPGVLVDVASGVLDFGFASITTALPLIKSGKLKALGHTGLGQMNLAPGIPSISTVVKGYKYLGWFGFVAPSDTPNDNIQTLNKLIKTTLFTPEIEREFTVLGFTLIGDSPSEMAAKIRAERFRMSALIKQRFILAN